MYGSPCFDPLQYTVEVGGGVLAFCLISFSGGRSFFLVLPFLIYLLSKKPPLSPTCSLMQGVFLPQWQKNVEEGGCLGGKECLEWVP